jgi:NTP pyrophosphatase (non-canonical NTP hydrolase)
VAVNEFLSMARKSIEAAECDLEDRKQRGSALGADRPDRWAVGAVIVTSNELQRVAATVPGLLNPEATVRVLADVAREQVLPPRRERMAMLAWLTEQVGYLATAASGSQVGPHEAGAAVELAMARDFAMFTTASAVELLALHEGLTRAGALAAVLDERGRQDARWGRQDHEPAVWLAILVEELGELAEATLADRFGNAEHGTHSDTVRIEAVQVAAVACAWTEHLDRVVTGEVTR